MPAHRSAAEAEIRDAVVQRTRRHRPNARVVHEINVGTYGANRIDVLAVDREEIVAFEIKSSKDKLDRLSAQMSAMNTVAHHSIAAIHEKFLVEQKTNVHAAHYERDGTFYLKTLPEGLIPSSLNAWVYPELHRGIKPSGYDTLAKWHFPAPALHVPLPANALGLLWRDELYALCGLLRVPVRRRADMRSMTSALRWSCTGRQITRGICRMLRSRACIEADPAVVDEGALA